ncbi:MAG: DUF3667 domain-containing protein [Pseudomonadales bacterium]|jgi:hypothetical protein|nr:DUF3667 domain-containing protein [Pseudomonadales bacterium]
MQAATCPNCDTVVNGPFCSTCGQSQKNLNKQIWTLTGELLDDVVRLDSRVVRTLGALIFKPGFLTREYFLGRRARYSPPVRLYLIVSFLFFFLMPALNELNQALRTSGTEIQVIDEGEENELATEFSGLRFDWLTEEENEALEARLEQQVRKTVALAREEPTQLYRELMDYMSAVMFFMLPVFAMFLKLTYVGSGVYYAEHLLLAVHNHCFLFITLMLSSVLDTMAQTPVALVTEPIDGLLLLWIPIYMFLSLRTVFQESVTATVIKYLFLVVCYSVLVTLGLMAALIIGVMTL